MSRYRSDSAHPGIDKVQSSIAEARDAVVTHPVYDSLRTLDAVAAFATYHVFAVWDFMSLLKHLQRELTCVTVPWWPRGAPATRRLINEIVTAEESDDIDGEVVSHLELYRRGMVAMGADTGPFDDFLARIAGGEPPLSALAAAGAPPCAADFVTTTWHIITDLPIHCQAAAFAFGREDLIPGMFARVGGIDDERGRLAAFRTYLERHIEVDADAHTPMAMRMLIDLCGDDARTWDECAATARLAVEARLRFWDAVHHAIDPAASRT